MKGCRMTSQAEYEQEIKRRESRFVEAAAFRRVAPVIGVSLAAASLMVEIAALIASGSMSEVLRVAILAAAFLSGTLGLGLVLLGTLPHQITLDMRRDLLIMQLAEEADEKLR